MEARRPRWGIVASASSTPRRAARSRCPTPNGRYWITYNGELYNFRELRGGARGEGISFRSDCDTEVLLAMYAAHGEAMLERLNGIFAFAIWDAEQASSSWPATASASSRSTTPQHDGVLYFASEVKALLPALPPRVDPPRALADYLTFLWVPDPTRCSRGSASFRPATARPTPAASCDVREYWDMRVRASRSVGRARVGRARSRDRVSDAVRRQMVSDVPLGRFLSGGLDSGAIVATMRRRDGRRSPPTRSDSARRTWRTRSSPTTSATRASWPSEFGLDYHERDPRSRTSSISCRSSSGTWTSRSPTRRRSRPT